VVFVVVALLLLPLAELAVMIWVGQVLGVWETIALLLMVSVLGAWIVKRQGAGAWRRIRDELGIGRVPTAALVDGALILTAGVLFLIPGFLTDVLAILLLLPPSRALARRWTGRHVRVMASVGPRPGSGQNDAFDVESRPTPRPPQPPSGHRELGA
jgi:UPF0716 protein FxsA